MKSIKGKEAIKHKTKLPGSYPSFYTTTHKWLAYLDILPGSHPPNLCKKSTTYSDSTRVLNVHHTIIKLFTSTKPNNRNAYPDTTYTPGPKVLPYAVIYTTYKHLKIAIS